MKKHFVFPTVVFLQFFVSINVCNAQSANKVDFPILSSIYNFDKEPVDYIIVIDRSGTVKPYWNEIKSSVNKVINLTKEGDYLTIIGFHSSVDYLVLPRTMGNNVKRELIDEVNSLSLPNGSRTDLFESIDKTLENINRPSGSRLQIIFYFTDFKNDPPPGSKWNASSISSLTEKRLNYINKTGKLVNIFAFQLPLEAGAGRDYEQFSQIFDNRVKRIISDLNTMQEWFGRLSQEISREKLKLILQNDLNSFISIKNLSVDGDQIKIDLHNKLGSPVTIIQASLKSGNIGLNLSQTLKGISIPANGNSVVLLSISEFLMEHESLLEKHIKIVNPQIALQCSFSNLESEFGKLNIPTKQIQTITSDQTLDAKTGIPYWIIGAAALLLILIIYLTNKTWLKHEWTFNRKGFKVTVTLNGQLLPNSSKTYEKSKKPIIIEHTIINASDISPEMARIISESKFKIFIVPSKPRFLSLKPKRGTYLFAEAQGMSFMIKKLVRGNSQFASLSSNRRLYNEQAFLHKGVTIVGELTSGITKNQLEINFSNK